MKGKFTYTGIRVKDLDTSVAFYTKVLGMKDVGRSTVDATKGQTASLASEEGGFVLELNYYEKGATSRRTTLRVRGSTTWRSKLRTSTRPSRKRRGRGILSSST